MKTAAVLFPPQFFILFTLEKIHNLFQHTMILYKIVLYNRYSACARRSII